MTAGPEPMAKAALAWVMQARAVPVAGTDPARRQQEWMLRFAPPGGPAEAVADHCREIAYLVIQGVAAPALRGVRLHAPGSVGLEIDSLLDARGALIPAGELVDSMAWASGLPSMMIDSRGRGLRWASTTVTLRIQSDGQDGAERASVTVLVQ
ncbi:hypothetical protein [Ideonella sp. A 288]|uniref:hypothetical protein n=1 Tax=Ideonella sp. A 288 TaxID=1962181 RepID=UPI000B4AE63B|nr:hypothetical protein [Ideonella sp. A 288]